MSHILLRDADQMSMAHTLEVRVPLIDHELVSFVLALPDEYKMGQWDKQLLIQATQDLIHRFALNILLHQHIYLRFAIILVRFCKYLF